MKGPDRLDEVLAGFVQRRRWGRRLRDAAVFERWEEIVGSELACRCEPVRLAGGRLVIRAESQVWATELGFLADRVRSRACALLGPGSVQEVAVVVGALQGLARARPD